MYILYGSTGDDIQLNIDFNGIFVHHLFPLAMTVF